MKVNVGIPIPGGSIFHDWAVIQDIDEDLVELQLSRDSLPEGVRLLVGAILDIRGGREDNAYSCRGIIVTEGAKRMVLLRLIGEIVSDELREYYRIDAFLPIKYFLTATTGEYALKKDWQAKREARADAERIRREQVSKPWQRLMLPTAEVPDEGEPEPEERGTITDEPDQEPADETGEPAEETDRSWDDVIPLAANISGGGIRLLMHHQFKLDDLVILEIFVPTEPQPRVLDAVGKVVFVAQNHAASKQLQHDSFNTGIEFLFLDERDRDTIVSYISNVQLKRIRQLREQYLGRGINSEVREPSAAELLRTRAIRIVMAILLLLLFGVIGGYFNHYVQNRPKSQIERIFDQGFMEYLKKIGKGTPAQTED